MLLPWLVALVHAGPIAIVVDGYPTSPAAVADGLADELRLLGSSYTVDAADVFGGEPTVERHRRDLVAAVSDPRFDAVIALGPLVSAQTRELRSPRVPVVAAVDLSDQPTPRRVYSIPLDLDVARAVEFGQTLAGGPVRLVAPAVLVDSGLLGSDVLSAVAPLPVAEDVRGLVVLPMVTVPTEERARLYSTWEDQGLVTVALQDDLDDGATASLTTARGFGTVLRRIAVLLSDLEAGREPVLRRLTLRTTELQISAPALGRLNRTPPFTVLAEAEIVGAEETRTPIDLRQAVAEALRQSPNLASIEADLAAQDTAVAQSVASWLPGVDVSVTGVQQDPNAISALQPQTSLTGALTTEQLIFSDPAVVNLNTQQDLRRARNAEWAAAEQDIVYDVASAYVALIRTYAVLDVRRADLARVRESLQYARDRQRVGDVAATEVARWESEFASAESNLVAAFVDVQNVQIGLNQLLGADPSRTLQPASLEELVSGLPQGPSSGGEADRLARALADFAVDRAPTLEQLDQLVQAQERQARSQRRQYWLPTVAGSLTVNGNFYLSNVDGNGGATPTATPTGTPPGFDPSVFIVDPPLFTWQAAVSASLPLFSGGGRRASQREAQRSLRSLSMQRETLRQSLVARARDAINQLVASNLRADLGEVQVQAVQRTLDAAIDAYARGATTQTTVTEARTSALNAELGSTNATYDAVQAGFDILFVAGALPTPSNPDGPRRLRDALDAALEAPR